MTFINVEKECDRLDDMYSFGDIGRRERDDIAIFMQEIATPVDAIPIEWINKYANEHRAYIHAFAEMVVCWNERKEE